MGDFSKSKPGFTPRRYWPFLAVFILAFSLRLAHLIQIKSCPFFNQLMVDAGGYDIWARKIAGAKWTGETAFFQDPLYPYLLGIIYLIFGHNLFLSRFIQIVIGSGAALLSVLLGTEPSALSPDA